MRRLLKALCNYNNNLYRLAYEMESPFKAKSCIDSKGVCDVICVTVSMNINTVCTLCLGLLELMRPNEI